MLNERSRTAVRGCRAARSRAPQRSGAVRARLHQQLRKCSADDGRAVPFPGTGLRVRRLHVARRRTRGTPFGYNVDRGSAEYAVDDLLKAIRIELDEANARLSRDGTAVTLARRPFGLLCALARRERRRRAPGGAHCRDLKATLLSACNLIESEFVAAVGAQALFDIAMAAAAHRRAAHSATALTPTCAACPPKGKCSSAAARTAT